MNSKEGWFNIEDIGEYAKKISFIPQMHGGICFIRKGKNCENIYNLALKIVEDYNCFKFKYFEKPADEPILALSSAVYNCKPTIMKPEYYIFYPCTKTLKVDIFNGKLSYTTENMKVDDIGVLVYWQNLNTKKALYKFEVDVLNKYLIKNKKLSFWDKLFIRKKIKLYLYIILVSISDLKKRVKNKL